VGVGVDDQITFGAVEEDADLGVLFVVGHPGAYVEDERAALFTGVGIVVGGGDDVGDFFLVVEDVHVAHGGDAAGEGDAEAPAGDVELVYALVADVAVAVVPHVVPVVVEAVFVEGTFGRGSEPDVVVDACGDFAVGVDADGVAPAVAEAAGHVDFADGAVLDVLNGFLDGGVGPDLGAVLDDAVVFAGGFDELAAFIDIMGAGLFDVDVFAGLDGPDGGEGVPVVGGGDGDDVDVGVFHDAAEVGFGLGRGKAVIGEEFFDAGREEAFVDVADRDDFDVLLGNESAEMGLAASAEAEHGDADGLVGRFLGGGGGGGACCGKGCAGGGFFHEVSASEVGHGKAPGSVGGHNRTVDLIARENGTEFLGGGARRVGRSLRGRGGLV